jgi:hypothetical protein
MTDGVDVETVLQARGGLVSFGRVGKKRRTGDYQAAVPFSKGLCIKAEQRLNKLSIIQADSKWINK